MRKYNITSSLILRGLYRVGNGIYSTTFEIGKCKNNIMYTIPLFILLNNQLGLLGMAVCFRSSKMATRGLQIERQMGASPFTRRLHHCRSSFISFNVIHDPTPTRPRRPSVRAGEKDTCSVATEEENARRQTQRVFLPSSAPNGTHL